MFRRRPQPAPVLPPLPVPEPVPLTSWVKVVDRLVDEGFDALECPAMCRRKGPHEHLRHTGASADVIVSPAAVERAGA